MRTNSKKAKEKIKKYLFNELFDDEGYDHMEFKKEKYLNEKEKALLILEIFYKEMQYTKKEDFNFRNFENYLRGLPTIIQSADYYYHNSAVDILGDILEETPETKNKYNELQAEKLLSYLIFKEIEKCLLLEF